MIDIEHNAINIEIQFSTLNHLHVDKVSYAYRLSCIDDQWHYLPQGVNKATFVRLPKGEYTMELMATDEYKLFKHVLAHPKEKLLKSDWQNLRKMMDEKIPGFYSEIHARKARLQEQDYDICILLRLFFTPSEIGILTNNSPSNISMKRIRLLKRIFGTEGSPEEFDKRIQSIY